VEVGIGLSEFGEASEIDAKVEESRLSSRIKRTGAPWGERDGPFNL